MRCRTTLLGGAIALVLSGAAYAQAQQTTPQANPGTDQINAGSAAATQTGTDAMTSTATTKSSTHHRHHARHHHHMRHHARTASTSSRGERQATRNLNEQQLQGGVIQTSAGGGGMNTGQPNMGNNPSPDTTAQPGASMQPNANAPSNATYTQPQGSQGMQPGNAGYQQPQNTTGEPTPGYSSAPGAAGPAGSQGNPVTPTDQNATPPPKDTSNPGS